MSLSIDETEGD